MIINIDPKLEPILAFLYPTHAILKNNELPAGKFILHKEVNSPSEQDTLNSLYPDGIFISSKKFDASFVYDYDSRNFDPSEIPLDCTIRNKISSNCIVPQECFNCSKCIKLKDKDINCIVNRAVSGKRSIRDMCIEYSRAQFGNRKTKLNVESKDLPQKYISFIYDLDEEEKSDIYALSELAGSSAFIEKFMELSMTVPISKLQYHMNKCVIKWLSATIGSDIRDLRKASVLAPKIRANMAKALDEYLDRPSDPTGLSICKFYSDLFV